MKMNDFFNEAFKNDEELKKEYELLETKYKLIEELIRFRKKNDISQKCFAEKIGVKQQAISRFEKGEIDPRLSFVEKILWGMKVRINFENKEYQNSGKILKFSLKEKLNISKKSFSFNEIPLEM